MDQIAEPGGKQRVCVYLLLHRHGNGSPDGCYASVTTLSHELGSSRRDVMAAIQWLITNGWATYVYDDRCRRHIFLNVDRRKQRTTSAQKGTDTKAPKGHRGIQKGTGGNSALLGTDTGIQKGTQTRTLKQDPSISSIGTNVPIKSIDADSPEKKVETKTKPMAPDLELHRDSGNRLLEDQERFQRRHRLEAFVHRAVKVSPQPRPSTQSRSSSRLRSTASGLASATAVTCSSIHTSLKPRQPRPHNL
jgi:ribosome assembly protein YihI (activator of Der GTPase)